MKYFVVIDHPWTGSFNYAICNAFCETVQNNGHTVDLLDLNQVGFNPIFSEEELAVYARGISLDPKVKDYQTRLTSADHIVLVFPVWWNVMPARMKGWLDKVFLPGFAFTKGKDPKPLLMEVGGATVLTTTSVPDEVHRRDYNNALDWVLCKGVFEFCGIVSTEWLNFGEAGLAAHDAHAEWLDRIRAYAAAF